MTFNEYQKWALKTAIYPENLRIMYPALGLAGEVGEVAEKVKKIYRDKDGLIGTETRVALQQEIGDVLWYTAVLAADLDLYLEDVAKSNIEKLKSRKKRGKLQGEGDAR